MYEKPKLKWLSFHWIFQQETNFSKTTMPSKWHSDCLHLNSFVKSSAFQIEVTDTVIIISHFMKSSVLDIV